MPARRATQQSLSVEPPNSSSSSPSSANFPRATSPSGITGLLSKPSKWFRSASGKNIPASVEPRSSTSSVTRKHKISHPTDPRPILSTLRSDPYIGSAGSRCAYVSFHSSGSWIPKVAFSNHRQCALNSHLTATSRFSAFHVFIQFSVVLLILIMNLGLFWISHLRDGQAPPLIACPQPQLHPRDQ